MERSKRLCKPGLGLRVKERSGMTGCMRYGPLYRRSDQAPPFVSQQPFAGSARTATLVYRNADVIPRKVGLQSRLKKHRHELFVKAGRSTWMHLTPCVKSLKRR